MANQKSEIRAIAEEDSEFIAIPIQYLDQWMNEYPDWKNLVMQTYSTRFRDLLNTIDNIAFRNMDERLEEYLFAKSQATQSKIINITHHEVATELGTSREVISRLLKQMEKKNKIVLGRNKIEVL
jgi:CRP/FNR family transcriptional regulator